MPNYVYKRRGGPLVKWTGAAPSQSRAADAVSLGCTDCGSSCACKKNADAARVPKYGAPEYISGVGDYVAVGDTTSAIEKIDDAVHTGAGRTVAMAANAFHGYRRNGSIMWALAWAALGYTAPVITTVIATAQGFGHKKGH